jgi:hypothetical protein
VFQFRWLEPGRALMLASLLVLPLTAFAASSTSAGFEQLAEREPLAVTQVHELQAAMLREAPKALARLEQAKTPDERFYALPPAAIAAFVLGRYDEARSYANECVAAADRYQGNWNRGNAIHDGHMVLGLVALHAGEVVLAKEELRLAGTTPGSPQLGSFGPSMQLARAMLESGYSEDVLAYFTQCRRFWAMGGTWLDIWEVKVREGQVPNFVMHAYR